MGGADDDLLEGNAGNDTLDGGSGDDVMRGGLGADQFVYTAGADVVVDFQPVDGVQIAASLLGASPEVEDLRDFASLDPSGNLVFDFGDGNRLTLLEFSNLDAAIADAELF
ncbi:hypothetical protein J1C49_11285 [Cognatishimia sp. F0-27]|nr:hypothetical protein [Cognatishimia sp. F0-27]